MKDEMRNDKFTQTLKLAIPPQEVEIIEPEDFEPMTIAEIQHEKELLSAQRQKVLLELDGKKLQQATKIMENMDMILDRMLDVEIDTAGNVLPISPQNLKFLTEAYRNLSSALPNNVRLDSVDSTGRAAAINLRIEFGQR